MAADQTEGRKQATALKITKETFFFNQSTAGCFILFSTLHLMHDIKNSISDIIPPPPPRNTNANIQQTLSSTAALEFKVQSQIQIIR